MQVFGAIGIVSLNSASTIARTMRTTLPILLTLICAAFAVAEGAAETKQPAPQPTVRLIGATAVVTVVNSGIPLPARVDTGATSCSIHCEEFEIENADPNPKVNIGKPVRFLVKHKGGEGEWLQAKIVDYVKIRTSESENERYKVRLKLRCEDVEKKVLVTLNDRERMKYPLLLGRNFLRDDFVVNVSLEDEK